MKRQISYTLQESTIQDIAAIARRQGLSESAVVDHILKDYAAKHKGSMSDLDNVKIGHLMDAVEGAKKRKK
jgi:hypothetical protein